MRAVFCLAALLVVACGSSNHEQASNLKDGGGSSPDGGGGPTPDGGSGHTDAGSGHDGGVVPVGDGGVISGRTSFAWAVDYPDDVFNVIAKNTGSFTHVATFVYDVGTYSGTGVAPFWNTPGGGDVFQNGLTSTTMAAKVHGMGLRYIATVSGGAELSGNAGIIAIIGDSPAGTQAGFITSMVNEAVKKKYDGYVLDWEMGGAPAGQVIDYATYGTKMESFLSAFGGQLHAHGMMLAVAIVPNDIKQSCTSYGNGVWDLKVLGDDVDLAMLEDYATTLGTASASCPASYSDPSGCFTGTVFGPFANEVGLLCADMKPGSVNIIMNAYSAMTNPFAGGAVSLLEAYGVKSAGLFPQVNSDGPGGSYEIYETKGIQPAGTTWFALLHGFLTQ
jgi:hypothetical protein